MVYPPTSALMFGQAMFTLNTNGMHRTVMPWTWRVFVAPWAGLWNDLGDDWGERSAIWKLDHLVIFMGKMLMKLLDLASFGQNFWILWQRCFFLGSFNTTFQGEHDWMNHWIHWIIFGVPLEGFFMLEVWDWGNNRSNLKDSENEQLAEQLAHSTKKQVLRKLIPPEPPLCFNRNGWNWSLWSSPMVDLPTLRSWQIPYD